MKKKNNNGFYTATEVSQQLNISVKTLTNWYNWYNDETIEKPKDTPTIPTYRQDHPRSPRLWTTEQINQLKVFQEWIPRGRNGVMGRYSERYWSKK